MHGVDGPEIWGGWRDAVDQLISETFVCDSLRLVVQLIVPLSNETVYVYIYARYCFAGVPSFLPAVLAEAQSLMSRLKDTKVKLALIPRFMSAGNLN